ncbi:hypothetical protein DBR18_26930 [Pseudomonas sp. HMWF021]|nr:hypothetical protein DBR18_26930 [Pseudomonas sp. HMWF021]
MIKILIVDDSETRVELIVDSIEKAHPPGSLYIKVCESSDLARQALLEHFDLLVLDVLLPKKLKGTPSAVNSTKLLSDICDPNKKYIRPSLTVGLTADIEYLQKHQGEFQKNAIVVLDGSVSNIDWLDTLGEQIQSLIGAKRKIVRHEVDRLLITIHGIRTFGKWQEALGSSMQAYSRDFEFVDVKYGFYDIVSFAIPYLRNRKAKQASQQVISALEANPGKHVYIVAHSFGTYVLLEALKKIKTAEVVKCVIMCGSPLPHDTDISPILRCSKITINECGINDAVLLSSRLLLWGTGDAGRVGFRTQHSRKFMNRYYKGGHSLYFEDYEDSSFYNRFWTETLTLDVAPIPHDDRNHYFGHDLVDLAVKIITIIKPLFYIGGAAAIIYALTMR